MIEAAKGGRLARELVISIPALAWSRRKPHGSGAAATRLRKTRTADEGTTCAAISMGRRQRRSVETVR